MAEEELKQKARAVLERWDWSEDSIKCALAPTPKQREERPYIPLAGFNPEQTGAIQVLHEEDWPVKDIASALAESEREIASYLSRVKQLLDFIKEGRKE